MKSIKILKNYSTNTGNKVLREKKRKIFSQSFSDLTKKKSKKRNMLNLWKKFVLNNFIIKYAVFNCIFYNPG